MAEFQASLTVVEDWEIAKDRKAWRSAVRGGDKKLGTT